MLIILFKLLITPILISVATLAAGAGGRWLTAWWWACP